MIFFILRYLNAVRNTNPIYNLNNGFYQKEKYFFILIYTNLIHSTLKIPGHKRIRLNAFELRTPVIADKALFTGAAMARSARKTKAARAAPASSPCPRKINFNGFRGYTGINLPGIYPAIAQVLFLAVMRLFPPVTTLIQNIVFRDGSGLSCG